MPKNKRPLLIYDGDCGFCQRWVSRLKFVTGNYVDYFPYQEVRNRFPDIADSEFIRSVQYIGADGSRSKGAEAVFRTLSERPNQRWLLMFYLKIPGLIKIGEVVYRIISKNRTTLSKVDKVWSGPHGKPMMILTREIFLRGLGLVYAVAFASVGLQILGLIGPEGILPANNFLNTISLNMEAERYWQFLFLYNLFFYLF